ncbi:hypothetical protein A0H81_07492 [Grifola frondosa]|uniref:Uncharacterized protein n=1 Tax=Grifola frondosa TaxID=5627 RepID=A0A1C7M758_GRIFR|nr:hypothetical protein A0H81_07492 [Grifola frondosa]
MPVLDISQGAQSNQIEPDLCDYRKLNRFTVPLFVVTSSSAQERTRICYRQYELWPSVHPKSIRTRLEIRKGKAIMRILVEYKFAMIRPIHITIS